MTLIEKLREESFSGHVAYTEFVLKQKKKKNFLFCFYEGKDDNKYYGIRIEVHAQRDYEHIYCGGKENVIKVKKLISKKREYVGSNISYFVDKDYGDNISKNELYCLPCYSIENLYANTNVLKKILKNEFDLKEQDEDYNKVLVIFKKLKLQFIKKTTFINAWLACQNDKRKIAGINTYLKIEKKIGAYFQSIICHNLKIKTNYDDLNDLEKIQSIFQDSPIISQKELNMKIKSFTNDECESNFRGKFQLSFFICFLDKLKSEICKKKSLIFQKKHKCSLRFEYSTSLTNLSIYAETPSCLIDYLIRKKK
ncbi:MAG: DUF4435 domain-containing protein [Candidatus Delongbacteria bacterium]|jgi:hypothetical protein|nr:DUF4435 domain-containing protein [Candidatus Delongbacteria bacterium]